MANTPNLKKLYQDEVAPALMQKFGYKSTMQIPRQSCGTGHTEAERCRSGSRRRSTGR